MLSSPPSCLIRTRGCSSLLENISIVGKVDFLLAKTLKNYDRFYTIVLVPKAPMLEIGLSFLVFGLLALVMVFLNSFLGPRKPNPAREKPFECGSPYLQTEIRPVRIPFFLIALFFLLLDVEAVFLFPLALAFREHGVVGFVALGSYILILAFGFAYAWKKGIFDWS